MKLWKSITLAFSLVTTSTAHAALITQTVTFSLSDFGVGAPYDPVNGSFTVSYDTDSNVAGQSVDSISFNGTSFSTENVYFDYTRNEIPHSGLPPQFRLDIYYDHDGAGNLDPYLVWLGQNDYLMSAVGFIEVGLVATASMLYSPLGDFGSYQSRNYSITASISAVPVPSAVWLFGSGLIGLIGLARHKKA